MTDSKTLVRQAIEFRGPERVPYNFDSNRTPPGERYGDDFEWVFSQSPHGEFPRALGDDRYITEFGIVYHRIGETFGEAIGHPLADPGSVAQFTVPDLNLPERFTEMERIVTRDEGKYILAMFPHFSPSPEWRACPKQRP